MKIDVINLGFIEGNLFVPIDDSANPTTDPFLFFNLKTRKRAVAALFNTNTKEVLYNNKLLPLWHIGNVDISDFKKVILDPRQVKIFERAATLFFTKEKRVFLDKAGNDHTNGVNQIRMTNRHWE